MQVEWHDGGGVTQLVGATKLGRMLGSDPKVALSLLRGLGRWVAGRSGAGNGHAALGLDEVGEEVGSSRSSSTSRSSNSDSRWLSSSNGGGKTPPKAPKKKPRHF